MTKSKHITKRWNSKECVLNAAFKSCGRKDFKDKFPGAYRAAKYTLGFYDELCNIMVKKGLWKESRRVSSSKYSLLSEEQIFQIAFQTRSLSELKNKFFLLCVEAKRRGIYKHIESHFQRLVHENNYWTELRIYELARQTKSRTEFCNESACRAAVRLGIYDKLVEDMAAEGVWDLSHYTHWTKETCFAKIREYETRSELIEYSWSAYLYARKHGFLEEACEHMERLGNAVLRKIYVFEFEDHSAYVGLTYNPSVRLYRHLHEEDSAVYLHIKSTKSKYEFKILTDFLDKDEAAIQEESFKQQYVSEGWNILNRVKCGSLGGLGTPKYTKEGIASEIRRQNITTRSEFNKKAKGMYLYAWRKDWLDELCANMPQREKSTKKVKWTDEMVDWAISQCNNRTELRQRYMRAYLILRETGRLDDVFPKQNPNEVRWGNRKKYL